MKEKIHQDSIWEYIALDLLPDRSDYNTEM